MSVEGIRTESCTFSVKNGIEKGRRLDLGAEPPRMLSNPPDNTQGSAPVKTH